MHFKRQFPLIFGICLISAIAEPLLSIGTAANNAPIVFMSRRDGNPDLYVMDTNGRNQRRLTNHRADDLSPTWSPDGKKIAFVSNRNEGYLQIWVMDADGGNPVRLTDGARDVHPDWSPDGKKIAYGGILHPKDLDNSPHVIFVTDADGKNERQLIDESGASPSWSPDGKSLAFVSGRHGDINQIYVMDADGRHQKRITDDLVDKLTPSWSPDGKHIAYASGNGIYVMDSDGKNQRKLTNVMGDEHPTWSPDSESIAFAALDRDGPVWSIYRVDVGSGAVNLISEDHRQGDYQPDWYNPGLLSVSPTGNRVTMWGRLKDIARSLP
ncbi:MAG: DPP IV N-terminal domain-containing protein [Candidatus Poribacteria bacterium]|nr:DPP IV N-terminal domain-containing protein [Candidatus Poribacteria bacterium]